MSYTKLFYHIVIRPYASERVLPDRPRIEQLFRYANGFITNKGGKLYRINSMPDHVHIAVTLPPTISISEFMREFKASTSKAMKGFEGFERFTKWSEGYACVTHCMENKDKVVNYIMNQQEHPKKILFREEYEKFIGDIGLVFDERDWSR